MGSILLTLSAPSDLERDEVSVAGRHGIEFQICELIAEVGLTGPQCLLYEICPNSPTSQECYRSHSHCLQAPVHNKGLFHARANLHPPEHKGN